MLVEHTRGKLEIAVFFVRRLCMRPCLRLVFACLCLYFKMGWQILKLLGTIVQLDEKKCSVQKIIFKPYPSNVLLKLGSRRSNMIKIALIQNSDYLIGWMDLKKT